MSLSEKKKELIISMRDKYPHYSSRELSKAMRKELKIKISHMTIYNYCRDFDKGLPIRKKLKRKRLEKKKILDSNIEEKNLYPQKKQLIDKYYIDGYDKYEIADILQIKYEKVDNYLNSKNNNGITRASFLDSEIERVANYTAICLIKDILNDRKNDYIRNRDFEKALIDTKKAELKILMEKIKSINSDRLTKEDVIKMDYLVNQIAKLNSKYTEETVSLLKDLGFSSSNLSKYLIQNNIQNINNTEKTIEIDDNLKKLLFEDD